MMTNNALTPDPLNAPIFPIALLDLAEKFHKHRGIAVASLYRRCEISPAQQARSDDRISGWQFRELLRCCRDIALPSPSLSLQLAQFIPITVPGGMFGLASFTAKTVQQALDVMLAFSHTVMPAYQFEGVHVGKRFHLTLQAVMDFDDVQHVLDESICAYILNLRHYATLPDPQIHVHLRHSAGSDPADFAHCFNARYHFDSKSNCVIFESHHLSQALHTHNQFTFDQVYHSLTNSAASEQSSSTSEKTRKLLRQRLALGKASSATQIAELLNVSERTLARRLNQEDSSFAEIKQQVAVDHARFLLRNTEFAICKIAQTCGYTSDSNFSRAFKSATGQTPKQYRCGD